MADGGKVITPEKSVHQKRWEMLQRAAWEITPEPGPLPGPREKAIKLALVSLWSMASAQTRQSFIDRLSLPPEYEFLPTRKQFSWMNDPDLEEAWKHWPYVLKGLAEDRRGLGISLQKAMQKKKVSEKQIGLIKKMYRDYRRWVDDPSDDGAVIE